jgi:hypothetical protein
MDNQYPHDLLHQSIVNALADSRLTTTGLARILSAENDKAPRTCEQQIRRLEKRLPMPVIELVSFLDALGYDVILKKRSKS